MIGPIACHHRFLLQAQSLQGIATHVFDGKLSNNQRSYLMRSVLENTKWEIGDSRKNTRYRSYGEKAETRDESTDHTARLY